MSDGGDRPAAKPKRTAGRPGLSRRQRARRRLVLSILAGASVSALGLAGYYPIVSHATADKRLRPPGAIDEREFLAACIKCGQCVQVCPVEAIVLADFSDGIGNGAPYLIARDQACDFSCDAVQCVLACPTGALSHEIDKKEQVRMGLAVLTRPELCLARQGAGFKGVARGEDFKGLHRYIAVDRWNPIRIADHPYDLELCDLCVRECPIEGAIRLYPRPDDPSGKSRTPVVTDKCVGCGMCEMICPTEPAAITVVSRLTYAEAKA